MRAVVITRRTNAATVAAKWKEQYCHRGSWISHHRDSAAVHKALLALGPNPNPDDVDGIIGNSSWTETETCDGCGSSGNPRMVRVGAEPDYESSTAYLCPRCVTEAHKAAFDEND